MEETVKAATRFLLHRVSVLVGKTEATHVGKQKEVDDGMLPGPQEDLCAPWPSAETKDDLLREGSSRLKDE